MDVELDRATAARYHEAGLWGDETIGDHVRRHAIEKPAAPAFIETDARCSWQRYDEGADRLAGVFVAIGTARGDKVAVVLPDGPTVHMALVAAERAGVTAVGIGHRAGEHELTHLLQRTGATVLVTHRSRGATRMDETVARLRAAGLDLLSHVVVPELGRDPRGPISVDGQQAPEPTEAHLAEAQARRYGPDDLFLLNSTSGTTGLPKCVMHTQNRWVYFHQLAVDAGDLGPSDVFLSAIPAPFGFGLWTAHFTPALLGAPTVLSARFDAATTLDLIEREQVTVLACVSTQFIMLLNEHEQRPRRLASLRCLYTGGEAVPHDRAAEFERETGGSVLQFYGSNETGALSYTTLRDTREDRLTTAGRTIDAMHVELFDEGGAPLTDGTRRGIPGCRGPATAIGYYSDSQANDRLFTADGWMLMGDIVELDERSYLRVVGRSSDFIIRGGKNISAPAVEQEVGTHPAVAVVAAVAMPDPVFGERLCVYIECRPGWTELTLDDIVAHLNARGVTKEWFPERLIIVDELPRSSGGKIAKGELRDDIRRRLDEEAGRP